MLPSKLFWLTLAGVMLTASGCTTQTIADSPVANASETPTTKSAAPVELKIVRPALHQFDCEADGSGAPSGSPSPGVPTQAPVADAAAAIKIAKQVSLDHETARSMGWEQREHPRAAAVLMPYRLAVGMAQANPDDQVAGSSCVWLVTVEEPYLAEGVRAGAEPKVLGSYTSIVLQASGETVDRFAGAKAPNLITGKHVGLPCPVGETPWPQ